MGTKHYPADFKADAVALYRSRPGAPIKSVATDLGVNTERPRNWIRAADGRRAGSHSTSVAAGANTVEAELAAAAAEDPGAGGAGHSRQGSPVFRRGDALVNRGQSVDDHQRRFGVKRLCDILGIARSATGRSTTNASPGSCGPPDWPGSACAAGTGTTITDPAAGKAPDLIGRDFTAELPNTKYVGDITYLSVDGGKFCYLATVIDLASRRLAGWAIAEHMRTSLVTDAVAAAERTRGSLAGEITHADHGAQYTSRAFADACHRAGIRQSMSAVGAAARTTPPPNRSKGPSKERPSKAEMAGQASARPGSTPSAG
ncbi:DDE-type integrase/transposase/recombinase [Streptomyces exfoliatus]|uniref:DDE-type integrase/transposase/recombinase n=1 Tax=Streptomyces exfoliatus TaxID=1905 RepID=A0ABV3CQ29_STREX